MHAHHTTALKPPLAWPARAWLLGALLGAVVLLQMFGLIHRTAHAPHAPMGVVAANTASNAVHAGATAISATGATRTKALFAGHSEGAACVLYDQLGQAEVLFAVPAVLLPDAAAIRPEAVHPAWHLAHQAAGFLARGPPSRV